jgi:hypothetical protein
MEDGYSRSRTPEELKTISAGLEKAIKIIPRLYLNQRSNMNRGIHGKIMVQMVEQTNRRTDEQTNRRTEK